jgi:glycosyltransferase involved in cell wall biosynthesis
VFHLKFATILEMKISAVIIAFNEEENIEHAIRSVSWADEILVVDSLSTDRTVEIARSLGTRVISREWSGFSDQKQFATDAAENDWILSIDADERVTDELRNEIAELDLIDDPPAGFKIPRLSYYMGKPIRHGGWYPDRQLRLFDRTRGRWNGLPVHESFEVNTGETAAFLRSYLLHFSVESAEHHHKMIGERYAPLAAQRMLAEGRKTSFLSLALAGPAAFIRGYFLKLGFLDGLAGFAIARFAAHHAFLKHLILYELQSAAKEAD